MFGWLFAWLFSTLLALAIGFWAGTYFKSVLDPINLLLGLIRKP